MFNWGSIGRDFVKFASKRLTPTEVDPRVSNGHEFQGTKELIDLLGSEDRRDIPTDYCLMADKGLEPGWDQILHSSASWYDARRNKPRRAEWRLYYPREAGLIQSLCTAGDLMIIARRRDDSLAVILAPGGSASEVFLKNVFHLHEAEMATAEEFDLKDAASTGQVELSGAEILSQLNFTFAETASEGVSPFAQAVTSDPSQLSIHDPEIDRLTDDMMQQWPKGELGESAEVCALVARICPADAILEPDRTLVRWLEAAEASYRRWESEMMSRFLGPLRKDEKLSDVNLATIISKRWMSYRQSRVSRSGEVMELFIEIILKKAGVKFQRHARTEFGKRPDFLFPGESAYKDDESSDEKLRILGSKTSFKDRWRQILTEGDRVKIKHGITRDIAITSNLFRQMREEKFVVVMPTSVIGQYAERPADVISLADFIAEVKTLQA